MVRDVSLYITVPHFFRCPISLDVMKSPVSLCTGVTYDRSSIQRWLERGNNTCPATMQVLQSKEFVPNRTLQRLIQIWITSHPQYHRNDAVPRPADPSRDKIEVVIKGINMTSADMDKLCKIELFAKESEENRSFLANSDGFLPLLGNFLGNSDGDKNIEIIGHVVRVLDTILDKIGDRQKLMTLILNHDDNSRDCLSSLLFVIRQGKDPGARMGSVRLLESIAIDPESKLRIADHDGLIEELVRSISPETELGLMETTLSCLIALSTAKRVKVKLVNVKAIHVLRDILSSSARDVGVSATEKALKLLETLASCKEGREEVCREKRCVEAVVGKVMKVSGPATEHAVAILWRVCYIIRDDRAQEAVMRSNGLPKVLLLMQSNCSPEVRQMAAELLKVLRVNSKSSKCILPCYDTNTIHVMPF